MTTFTFQFSSSGTNLENAFVHRLTGKYHYYEQYIYLGQSSYLKGKYYYCEQFIYLCYLGHSSYLTGNHYHYELYIVTYAT